VLQLVLKPTASLRRVDTKLCSVCYATAQREAGIFTPRQSAGDGRALFLQMEPNKNQDSRVGFGRCVSEAVHGLN
jgi:hypothetical protein